MSKKEKVNPERVLIVAMVEPDKPDPLTVLHRIKTKLEGTEGVISVDIEQVGGVPASARTFESDLEQLINARCLENGSMTPDFILASFLKSCLDVWNKHTVDRDRWWSHKPSIGEYPINRQRLLERRKLETG